MSISSKVTIARRFGLLASVISIFYNGLKRVMYFKAIKGMTLTLNSIDKAFLEPHPTYAGEIVRGAALSSLCSRESDISSKFVAAATARDDWAYVFRDSRRVASSGWYSNRSVAIDACCCIQFADDFVYMYKGLTHPDYRGEKLHAYGMAGALLNVAGAGKKGLISYVEVDNFASLRSCDRLGYEIFGTCIIIRILGMSFVYSTPGCKHFDFNIKVRR